MNLADPVALSPLVVLGATSLLVLLAVSFRRAHGLTVGLTLLGLGLALAALPAMVAAAPRQVTALFVADSFAAFFIGLLVAAALVVAGLAYAGLRRHRSHPEEFYVLLLLATLGAAALVASSHFASFFLSLELLSIALYALIAYPRWRELSIEAGVKYLILAAASSAFLLFGMALVYADRGTMAFAELAEPAGFSPLVAGGLAMILVGIGFKLAVVPFHMWTPDVYQGGPVAVAAFLATVSKGAVFALAWRFFALFEPDAGGFLFWSWSVLAVASMLAGNLLALRQNGVKRILAYSSIAHMGYLLIALVAGGALAANAATVYLVTYFVTALGAFAVVAAVAGDAGPDDVDAFRGLVWSRPWLGAGLTATLLSLAGIPLTAGFVGKFYLALAGVGAELWWLVLALVAGSVIGIFYYLRVVIVLYQTPPAPTPAPATRLLTALVVGLTLALVWFGVYPGPLLEVVEPAVAGMLAAEAWDSVGSGGLRMLLPGR